MIGPLFLALWRRVVKNAGGAAAIPLPAWLRNRLPASWVGKVDDKINNVGRCAEVLTPRGDLAAFSCAPHIGRFLNATPGYGWTMRWDHNETRGWWIFRYTVPIYEFTFNMDHPLTYEDAEGGQWQGDKHSYHTDSGSIPPPASWFADYHPMKYPISYGGFHDPFFAETKDDPMNPGVVQHGLWYKAPGATEFVFRSLARTEGNRLCLVNMLQVEGASLRQAERECWAVEHLGKRW